MRDLRGLPLFPLLPIVPIALFAGSVTISAWCLARVRKLSKMILPAETLPAEPAI